MRILNTEDLWKSPTQSLLLIVGILGVVEVVGIVFPISKLGSNSVMGDG